MGALGCHVSYLAITMDQLPPLLKVVARRHTGEICSDVTDIIASAADKFVVSACAALALSRSMSIRYESCRRQLRVHGQARISPRNVFPPAAAAVGL